MGRRFRQHADDLAGGLGFGGADDAGDAVAVLCRNAHHQFPDAPPPPDDPPPPEKPPPDELLLPRDVAALKRMFSATLNANQRNPGKIRHSMMKTAMPSQTSQLAGSRTEL